MSKRFSKKVFKLFWEKNTWQEEKERYKGWSRTAASDMAALQEAKGQEGTLSQIRISLL